MYFSSESSRRRSEIRRASNTDAALSICSRVGFGSTPFQRAALTSSATPIASSTDRMTRTRRSGSAIDSARSRTETSLPSSLHA
jgi:hypothetical protein